ncbi:hypothetical protein CEXT_282391 [Caerostris extrusa]|uniref:Uncharacterized protein n=1 Tax=Caerostris extrusa TaxID=172846 RepID=A0AAV4RD05_CAEEX|nr:hypothetical protein CEXT_282391 [Caerostris extrusa]
MLIFSQEVEPEAHPSQITSALSFRPVPFEFVLASQTFQRPSASVYGENKKVKRVGYIETGFFALKTIDDQVFPARYRERTLRSNFPEPLGIDFFFSGVERVRVYIYVSFEKLNVLEK